MANAMSVRLGGVAVTVSVAPALSAQNRSRYLGDTIILDETLGIGNAVAMVWDLRSVSGSSTRTLTIPTESMTLEDGTFAVRATTSFVDLISG